MTTHPLQIEVWNSKDTVAANVIVENTSASPLYLESSKFGLKPGLFLNTFKISTGGQNIPFTGPMLKLPSPGPDDFVTIAPGEKRTFQFQHLEKFYAFISGSHRYLLKFQCISSRPDGKGLTRFESNQVEVQLTN